MAVTVIKANQNISATTIVVDTNTIQLHKIIQPARQALFIQLRLITLETPAMFILKWPIL